MRAITTNSSISVKPRWRVSFGLLFICDPGRGETPTPSATRRSPEGVLATAQCGNMALRPLLLSQVSFLRRPVSGYEVCQNFNGAAVVPELHRTVTQQIVESARVEAV